MRSHHLAIFPSAIVLLIVLIQYQTFLQERIPVNQGSGWDGQVYEKLVTSLPDALRNKEIDQYRIQRILPTYFVRLGFQICDIQPTAVSIQTGFFYFNVMCSVASIVLMTMTYNAMVSETNLHFCAFVICSTGLVINYPVLKMASYYPVLTDIPALATGASFAYFMARRHHLGLLIMTVVGAFVWPTFRPIGMVLTCLPLIPIERTLAFPQEKDANRRAWVSGFKLMSLTLGATFAIYLYLTEGLHRNFGTNSPNRELILFAGCSTAIQLLWVIDAFSPTMRKLHEIKYCSKMNIALFAVSMTLVSICIKRYSTEPSFTGFTFLGNLVSQCLTFPFGNLASHFFYYGPTVALIIVCRREISERVKEYGWGGQVFFLMTAVLALGSESRQLINIWPIWLMLVMRALPCQFLNFRFCAIHFLLSLFYSRFWLTLQLQPEDLITSKNYQEFPAQWYFMSQGPWTSYSLLTFQLGCLAMMIAVYHRFYRQELS